MANLHDRAFRTLEQTAIVGERCPENGVAGLRSDFVCALAHQGRILVEISGNNWRRVTILKGDHVGKSTAPNPDGLRVWKTIDANGTLINGRPLERGRKKRPQPSAPRALSREELRGR